jgi:hypothetical protein
VDLIDLETLAIETEILVEETEDLVAIETNVVALVLTDLHTIQIDLLATETEIDLRLVEKDVIVALKAKCVKRPKQDKVLLLAIAVIMIVLNELKEKLLSTEKAVGLILVPQQLKRAITEGKQTANHLVQVVQEADLLHLQDQKRILLVTKTNTKYNLSNLELKRIKKGAYTHLFFVYSDSF